MFQDGASGGVPSSFDSTPHSPFPAAAGPGCCIPSVEKSTRGGDFRPRSGARQGQHAADPVTR